MQPLTRSSLLARRQGLLGFGLAAPLRSGQNAGWVVRRAAFVRRQHVEAFVVGSGPAGIAAVGNLLEHIPEGKIGWADFLMIGGRIPRRYTDVPSNTKVKLFLEYAKAVEPFREIIEQTPPPNAVAALDSLPHDKTCSLGYVAEMLRMMVNGLRQNSRVDSHTAEVTDVAWEPELSQWRVTVHSQKQGTQSYTTPLVVFCTGASPAYARFRTRQYDHRLDPFLSADFLRKMRWVEQRKKETEPFSMAVVGASHSAVIVLRNLYELARDELPHMRITWLARGTRMCFAEERDGWILHDNKGLKGEAAEFAREQLDGDAILNSPAGKFITRVDVTAEGPENEMSVAERYLKKSSASVHAVGYKAENLPLKDTNVSFNHHNGEFIDAETQRPVRGLYGAGIAFPELVTDPEGNQEYNVGLHKFMTFLKRVVPQWVEKAKAS